MVKFKTLVKNGKNGAPKQWADNDYVLGRISGFMNVLCDGDKHSHKVIKSKGTILTAECEPEAYEKFVTMVEDHYPGLCEFNYSED